MKAVLIQRFGDANQLAFGNWEKPMPKPHQLLVRVQATALNRADILQRQGKYPPPKNASPILGLEIAGEVVEVGQHCTKYNIGDLVFGLLSGGGYAEFAVIAENMALPIPQNWTAEQAAAVPEVFLTAYQTLHWLGKIQKHEKTLIHAGGSGIGTALIQLAKCMENEIFVTASEIKHKKCKLLGANHTLDYQTIDFQKEILGKTAQKGVNLIIDVVGAPYFMPNLKASSLDARIIMLALMGGFKISEINIAYILTKRLQIIGSTLRSRTWDYQAKLTADFWKYAQSKFENQTLRPVIDSVWEWENVVQAHQYMEANQNFGKIILKVT